MWPRKATFALGPFSDVLCKAFHILYTVAKQKCDIKGMEIEMGTVVLRVTSVILVF